MPFGVDGFSGGISCKKTLARNEMIYKHTPVISGVLVLLIPLSLGCGISFSGPPEGPCPIDTLLIDKTSLPETIFYETGSRSAEDAPSKVGIEKIGTSFASFDKGGVEQYIYRFISNSDAKQEYEDVAKYYFEKKR
jgi:hypothetical protein